MKRPELLAPAGDMECLKSAIMAGCDAVYLGGYLFGARTYASNFSDEELVEAINYAHLYGVKVYVTTNIVVFEDEVEMFMNYIDFLYKNNVDAVIMQDLGMFDLVKQTYPNLEIHISTQVNIHNLDGVLLMEKLGASRVVLARETSLKQIKKIKENTKLPLEVFVHGALCISYSGQCLMSSLLGNRSGNRGSCVGACRLNYDIVLENGDKLNTNNYPLSSKDLCTIDDIGMLIEAGIDSFKIEGRMKSKEYVYIVTSLYRRAIDSYLKDKKIDITIKDIEELKKIFNREFTKGFLFEDNDIVNDFRPNHLGIPIGEVILYRDGNVYIKLSGKVKIGSAIRILDEEDYGLSLNDFYIGKNLVKEADKGDIICFKVHREIPINSKVLLTLDKYQYDKVDEIIDSVPRRVLINALLEAKVGKKISLTLNDNEHEVTVEKDVLEEAINNPTTKDNIIDKLLRIKDTPYSYSNLDIKMDDNVFVPMRVLNDLRRDAILELNKKRLYEREYIKGKYEREVPVYPVVRKRSAFLHSDTNNLDSYDIIYTYNKNKLPRIMDNYEVDDKEYLVGDIGALNKLKNVDSDFSFNVTNSYAVAFLHSLGVNKITLSYELSDSRIKLLIDNYHDRYQKHPNLELIVSGYEELMVCKYNLNKKYQDNIYLKDRFNNLFKIKTYQDNMYIYNYKKRDNYDSNYYEMGINFLRDNI